MARNFQERRKGRELSRYPLIQFMLTLLPWWPTPGAHGKPCVSPFPDFYHSSFAIATPRHKGATSLFDMGEISK